MKKSDRNILIIQHLTRSYKLAEMIHREQPELDMNELKSIVHICLCESAERYNESKGSFWNYVEHSIKGALLRYAIRQAKESI